MKMRPLRWALIQYNVSSRTEKIRMHRETRGGGAGMHGGSATWRGSKTAAVCLQAKDRPPEIKPSGNLDLGLPASRIVRKPTCLFVLFIYLGNKLKI